MEKLCRGGLATVENMAHALRMVDTLGYEHICSKCSTYCFSPVSMVGRTTLSVTLHVHCPSHLLFMCHLWRDSTNIRNPDWYLRRINACSIYTARNMGSGNNQILLSVLDISLVEHFWTLIQFVCLVRWWDAQTDMNSQQQSRCAFFVQRHFTVYLS